MSERAIQDYYPDNTSYCYGCGRLNDQGLHIRSFEDGDDVVCHFSPRPYHIAVPGFVYGGLLASLIDCHSTGSAAAAVYRKERRPMDSDPPVRFLTASLRIDYLRPTPLGPTLELRSRIKEHKGRKVVVETDLLAEGILCVHGEAVTVQATEELLATLGLVKPAGSS